MTTILGIDLGKFKSVCCVYNGATGVARFETRVTLHEELRELIETERPELVVFEASTQAGWVADLCATLGVKYAVANANGEAWKWKNVKRKTDRDDALKLARLAMLGELPTVEMPSPAVRQMRSLLKFRQQLIGQRVRIQNHIRALFMAQGLVAPRGHQAWTAAGLAWLNEEARLLEECAAHELWRGQLQVALATYRALVEQLAGLEAKLDELGAADPQIQLLETIPGVGRRSAEVVVAFLDNPQRFKNGRQVSAYAGLVPRQFQSGETDRRGRITRRGPSLLRKMLVEVGWVMLRYNDWAQQIVTRISKGQRTRRKQAVVALARKLLVRCWAMLRDRTVWRDPARPPLVAVSN
jgi:transposase